MENKLLTLEELEKTWWWRQPENKTELDRIKLGYLLAARNYELMRFAPNSGEYKKNFLELDRDNRTVAAMAWGKIVEAPNKRNYDPLKMEEGWTNPHPPLQWNLRLSKRQLKRAFLDYIDQQLKLQKLPQAGKLTGKKNRPPTWGYVEFLGKKRNKIGDMGDSERGMASKAEEMAIRCLEEFKLAQASGIEMGKEWLFYNDFDNFSEVVEMLDVKVS